MEHQFHPYALCASKDVLEVGDVVYIRPIKMTRLLHKKEVVASSQMSLEEFSQVHAVRKKVLMRLNRMNATDTILKGDVIVLGRGLFQIIPFVIRGYKAMVNPIAFLFPITLRGTPNK